MELRNPGASLFIPDCAALPEALTRTTHMAVMAHQDDIGIGAMYGVLQCFQQPEKWFVGVTVTNGAGSPRDDLYQNYTDEEMRQVRALEEKKAAYVGEYGACLLLDYPSSAVKDPDDPNLVAELKDLFTACQPRIVYTHNLADKHDTHVATTLRVIRALRELPAEIRPKAVYGCEVWRDLDWLTDSEKVLLDCTPHENLAAAIMGTYDSQICGGKRYDLATAGRRKAHATYLESHGIDQSQSLNFAMDLTPLLSDLNLAPGNLLQRYIDSFTSEVSGRVSKFS